MTEYRESKEEISVSRSGAVSFNCKDLTTRSTSKELRSEYKLSLANDVDVWLHIKASESEGVMRAKLKARIDRKAALERERRQKDKQDRLDRQKAVFMQPNDAMFGRVHKPTNVNRGYDGSRSRLATKGAQDISVNSSMPSSMSSIKGKTTLSKRDLIELDKIDRARRREAKAEKKKLQKSEKLLRRSSSTESDSASPYDEVDHMVFETLKSHMEEFNGLVDKNDPESISRRQWLMQTMYPTKLSEDDYDTDTEIFDGIKSYLSTFARKSSSLLKIFYKGLLFGYQLMRSRNLLDVGVIILQFIEGLPQKVTDMLYDTFMSLLKKTPEIFLHIKESAKGIFTEAASDWMTRWRAFLKTVVTSQVATFMKDVVLAVVSFKFFSTDVSKMITKFIGKKKLSIVEWIDVLLGHMCSLIKLGERLAKGEKFSEVMLEKDPLTSVQLRLESLLPQKDRLYYGVPVEGRVFAHDFASEMCVAVRDADLILKTASPLAEQTKTFKKIVEQCRNELNKLKSQLDASQRKVPYILTFVGPPGIGKSKIMDFVFRLFARSRGWKWRGDIVFHKQLDTEYWDPIEPYSQRICHYSELGNENASYVMRNGSKPMKEFCSIADSSPYFLNTAFGDKGTRACQFELIGVDTNNESLNSEYAVNNPGAIMRRIKCLKPRVLPQFLKDGSTTMIDPVKCMNSDTPFLERWTFDLISYESTSNKGYSSHTIFSGYDIYQTAEWLFNDFVKHHNEQLSILKKQSIMCVDDYLPEHLRNTQLEEEVIPVLTGLTPNVSKEDVKIEESEIELVTETNYTLMVHLFDYLPWVFTAFVTATFWQVFLLDVYLFVQWPGSIFQWYGYLWRQCKFLHSERMSSIKWAASMSWIEIRGATDALSELAFLTISEPRKLVAITVPECVLYAFISYVAVRIHISLLFVPIGCCVWLWVKQTKWYALVHMFRRRSSAWSRCKYHLTRCWNIWTAQRNEIFSSPLFFEEEKHLNKARLALTLMGAVASYKATWAVVNWWSKVDVSEFDVDPDLILEAEPTQFVQPHPTNEELNTIEEEIDACAGIVRIKPKNSTIWNTVELPISQVSFVGPAHELAAKVDRNVKAVRIFYPDGASSTQYMLGICEDFAVINAHALPQGRFELHHFHGGFRAEPSQSPIVNVIEPDQMCLIGMDLMLIRVPKLKVKDIRPHIPKDMGLCKGRGLIANDTVDVRLVRDVKVIDEPTGNSNTFPLLYRYDWAEHRKGKCGLPLVAPMQNGFVVAGIHCGGDRVTHDSTAAPFGRTPIENGIISIKNRTQWVDTLSEEPLPFKVEEPIAQSAIHFENTSGVLCFGKLEGPVLINQKSKLVPTPVAPYIEQSFEEVMAHKVMKRFGPPVMQPIKGRNYRSPWNNAIKKIGKRKGAVPMSIAMKAASVYSDRIIRGLRERGVTHVSPLNITTAINGAPMDPFLRRINMSTSGGFGFRGAKSQWCPIVEEKPFVIREPIPELKQRILDKLVKYKDGKSAGVFYNTSLKDEPRALHKIATASTRVFYPSSLDDLIIARMILGPFFTLMVEHGEVFGSSVGINMHSQAAKIVAMRDFSPFIMEGDYETYDIGMVPEVRRAVDTVIVNVMRAMGYNDFAIRVLKGYLSDLLFPFFIINLDVLQALGSQGSGSYGTAEYNCLVGTMMLLIAWYSIPALAALYFFSYVLPNTYGDDLLAAIKESVIHLFNGCIYAERCSLLFNMGFTPASKTGDVVEYLNIENCSFLKRTFTYRSDIQQWVAPLDVDSIIKSLSWYIPSKNVTIVEQFEGTVKSALWELAFHLSAEQHEKLAFQIVKIYKDWLGESFDAYISFHEIISRVFQEDEDCTSNSVVPDIHLSTESNKVAFQPVCGTRTLRIPHLDMASSVCREEDQKTNRHMKYLEESTDLNTDVEYALSTVCDDIRSIQAKLDSNHDGLADKSHRSLRRMLHKQVNKSMKARIYNRISMLDTIADLHATRDKLKATIDKRARAYQYEADNASALSSAAPYVLKVDENVTFDMPAAATSSAGVERSDDMTIMTDEKLGDFLSRPVEITSSAFTSAAYFRVSFNPWNEIFNNPSVRAKIKNYAYIRADIVLTINLSATPYWMGHLVMGYLPFADENVFMNALKVSEAAVPGMGTLIDAYVSQFPGAVVSDIKNKDPVVVRIPFISTKPVHRLFNTSSSAISASTAFDDMDAAGEFYIRSLDKVYAIGDTITPAFLQVYAHLENVKLSSPTATVLALTTESKYEEKTGPVEKVSSSLAYMMGALSKKGYLVPYSTAGHMVASGVASVANILGFSKPALSTRVDYIRNVPFNNTALTIDGEKLYKVAMDPLQELTTDPSTCGTTEDDMVIANIASRWSYFDTFIWSPSQDRMVNPIYVLGVAPNYARVATSGAITMAQPAALTFAAAPFGYWRGDITYKLVVDKTPFHAGKLAIFYEPNVSQRVLINADISLNKNPLVIFDISQESTIEFTIGWNTARPWLRVGSANDTIAVSARTAWLGNSERYLNGYFAIVPFTKLQSPEDILGVQVHVFAKCDELRVNQPVSNNLPTHRNYVTESLFTESSVQSFCDVGKTVDLTRVMTSTDHISQLYFGEEPISFRTLVKRYWANDPITGTLSSTTVPRYIKCVVPVYPANRLLPGSDIGGQVPLSLFEYLVPAYVGFRGGMRFKSKISAGGGVLMWTVRPIWGDAYEGIGWTESGALGALAELNGAVTPNPSELEIEIPGNSINAFQVGYAADYELTGTDVMAKRYYREWQLGGNSVTASAGGAARLDSLSACADDFSFMRFQGAPFYSHS